MSYAPKNPYVLAPMTTYSSLENGDLSPDEEPYLQRRAAFGTVITAACAVHPSGKAFRGQWACWDDAFLPSLRCAADAIRRGNPNAVSLLQIHHGGRSCPQDLPEGGPIAPSGIPAERPNASTPREMVPEEIERSIEDYAEAARRAVAAGFDGVEIHGANTYLIQQFVSPHSNRRADRWNADDLRFPIELTGRVRERAGKDAVVGYRFSPEEPETPGIRLDRTERLLAALLATGALDYLHVSLRRYDQESLHGDGKVLRHLAQTIKGVLPLVGVGEIRTAADVEAARGEGADLFAVGRAAVTDPEWVGHIERGEPIRTEFPRENWVQLCTVPAGLARKIEETPGWFPFEGDDKSVE